MKDIRVTFTDAEFKKLKKAKKEIGYNISWHNFIINKLTKGISAYKELRK
ncbi:MAG: hypothetical protein M0R35_07145 [Candidatus Omnitrophica bacterium]|nr:hypothetical protein [Candidatus Omnitrophota bacterium]